MVKTPNKTNSSRLEEDIFKLFELLDRIKVNILNEDPIYTELYEDYISNYVTSKKEFGVFLDQIKIMKIDDKKRDILWTLVFAFRDFRFFNSSAKEAVQVLLRDLKNKTK